MDLSLGLFNQNKYGNKRHHDRQLRLLKMLVNTYSAGFNRKDRALLY